MNVAATQLFTQVLSSPDNGLFLFVLFTNFRHRCYKPRNSNHRATGKKGGHNDKNIAIISCVYRHATAVFACAWPLVPCCLKRGKYPDRTGFDQGSHFAALFVWAAFRERDKGPAW